MREGNIILTSILQANGEIKNRPVLILREMQNLRSITYILLNNSENQRSKAC